MEIWTIVLGIGVIVGIAAGIVQVIDYFQNRHEKSVASSKKHKVIPAQPKTDKLDISKSPALSYPKQNTLNQIYKLISKAEQITKEVLKKFESDYVYPEDCDMAFAEMQSVWDNYLLKALELLDQTQLSSEKIQKLKSESRLFTDSLFREVRLVMQSIQEFRKICLENNLTTANARIKIRDRVDELHTRICIMLEQLI